jgi:riboflavin synthase
MFTGIIESTGTVSEIVSKEGSTDLIIESGLAKELKVDQSVSHNGVCLTVTEVNENKYSVTAIPETLKKTNLGDLRVGNSVNLERSMPANGRFDGHIVQGHVDMTGVCIEVRKDGDSVIYSFEYDKNSQNFTVEKGSVCVNGISLTVIGSEENRFSVAVIPYTFNHTNIQYVKVGDRVNLEFDIIGKYLQNLFLKYRFNQ